MQTQRCIKSVPFLENLYAYGIMFLTGDNLSNLVPCSHEEPDPLLFLHAADTVRKDAESCV